jgi:hypothetical protein
MPSRVAMVVIVWLLWNDRSMSEPCVLWSIPHCVHDISIPIVDYDTGQKRGRSLSRPIPSALIYECTAERTVALIVRNG